ncbi:MAG: prolipoprotein diacylglyceryl transferase, partial [Acidimicrobiales bacterium]
MIGYLSWEVAMRREFLGIGYFPHGLLIALGFLVGWWLLRHYTASQGLDLDRDLLDKLVLWIAVGGIAGTRLVWALGNWSELESPAEVLMIWHGGMTLYGGILGGAIAGIAVCRRHRLPILAMVDMAMPGLAAGLVIGRASDLITGDHLGKPTGLPWGFRYVGSDPPGTPPPLGTVVHPVALYDALLVAVLCAALVVFLRRPRAAGSAGALFALYYSTDRLFLDFLR